MKLILSRKGFDSDSGKMASPILPDGTLLSMPIPSEEIDKDTYTGLFHDGKSYFSILDELNPNNISKTKPYCHLDPDIRKNVKTRESGWNAAFGQEKSSLAHLRKQGVSEGDLFLFFGLFKETKYDEDGKLRFVKGAPLRHIIYGYLQIGEIITKPDSIPTWLQQHPHVAYENGWRKHQNAIFLASENLSISEELDGFGILNYREDRVLTKDGMSPSRWELPEFFRKVDISYHPNPWKDGYFQSVGRGQEFVMDMTPEISDWVKKILR